MPYEKGDFVLIDYTAKVKETGEVFDTTREDVAKSEKLYKEGEIYEPNLVVVGEGWVLKALDENILTLELNKAMPVEIPSEKAFASRDPDKVRLIPLKRLIAKGITPQLGMRVEFEGKLAIVRTIGAGRVQLDFNPPLAGKTLSYEITIGKKLETKVEKLNALIHRRIPSVDATKFGVKTKKTTVEIDMPEEAFYIEGVQAAKRGISIDIEKFFTEIETVKFTETFKRKVPATPKPAPAEKPAQKEKETTETKETATPEAQPAESAKPTEATP